MKDALGHGSNARGSHTSKIEKLPPYMSPHYNTEKGKTHTNIYDAKTGEYVTQLRNHEVRPWLVRADQSAKQDAEWAEMERSNRVAKAQSYLEGRKSRPPQMKQLELFK